MQTRPLSAALLSIIATISGCTCEPASPEAPSTAAQPLSEAYCSAACRIAGATDYREILRGCPHMPAGWIVLQGYSLTCFDADSAANYGPTGIKLCIDGCQGGPGGRLPDSGASSPRDDGGGYDDGGWSDGGG